MSLKIPFESDDSTWHITDIQWIFVSRRYSSGSWVCVPANVREKGSGRKTDPNLSFPHWSSFISGDTITNFASLLYWLSYLIYFFKICHWTKLFWLHSCFFAVSVFRGLKSGCIKSFSLCFKVTLNDNLLLF